MTTTPSASQTASADASRIWRQTADASGVARSPENASADAGEGLREAVDWLALEALNLERSGARTYEGGNLDAALANSGARLDRQRAARYRIILAALRQTSSEPVAWRDIATAPKDGTWFVALQDEETYPCQWLKKEGDEYAAETGWWDFFNLSFEEPTHWTPAAPEHAASERVRVLEEALRLARGYLEHCLPDAEFNEDEDTVAAIKGDLSFIDDALNPQSQEKGV